jgi:hypothetical protein
VKAAAATSQTKAAEVKAANQQISTLKNKETTQTQTEKAIAARIESTSKTLEAAQKAYDELKAKVTALQIKYNNAKTKANKAALAAQLAERKAALSKALADKALAAYNQAKKSGKLLATGYSEVTVESADLLAASETDQLKKLAEEALKQYEADLKAAAEARAQAEKAAEEFNINQDKLKSTVQTTKTYEAQINDAQKRLDAQKKILRDAVAKKEEIKKLISEAQVVLNQKKVELNQTEIEKSDFTNEARKASESLSSNIELYKSNQELIESTNAAIDALEVSIEDIQAAKTSLDEFNASDSKNLFTRNVPIIGALVLFSTFFIFKISAIKRRRRLGATQIDLATERTPDDFDVDIKKRRTGVETTQADREFEEFLINMRKQNVRLLADIKDNFGDSESRETPSRTVKASVKKPKAKAKKSAAEKPKKTVKKAAKKTVKKVQSKSTSTAGNKSIKSAKKRG